MTRREFLELVKAYWNVNEGNHPEDGEPTAIISLSGHCNYVSVSVYYDGFDMMKEHNGESWYGHITENSERELYLQAIAQLEYTALLARRWREKNATAKAETMNEVKKQYGESIAEIEARYDRRLKEIEERLKCVGL